VTVSPAIFDPVDPAQAAAADAYVVALQAELEKSRGKACLAPTASAAATDGKEEPDPPEDLRREEAVLRRRGGVACGEIGPGQEQRRRHSSLLLPELRRLAHRA